MMHLIPARLFRRAFAIVTIIAVLLSFALILEASDSFTVNSGANQNITAHSTCRKVTNGSATGLSVYVPTVTVGEWQSFRTSPPPGVTLSTCSTLSSAWQNLGSILPANIGNSQSAVIGGYVYLFGGRTGTYGATGAIYRASTANPTVWSDTGASLPTRAHSAEFYMDSTHLYIFGGHLGDSNATNDSQFLNTVFRAPISNPLAWENMGARLPGKLAYSTLFEVGNHIYLVGGARSYNTFTNVIYRASKSDPITWASVGTLPTNLAVSQSLVMGDYVYLFGGRTGVSTYTNIIYRASISNPISFSDSGGRLPYALSFSTLYAVGDYMYLLGGYSGSSNANVLRAAISNPLAWTNLGAQLPAGLDSSTAQIIGDYLYLISGANNSAWATRVVYRALIQ